MKDIYLKHLILIKERDTKMLENLKPERVMKYFEDICSIPHGSGDTGRIADYCENFAKSNNLEYCRDEHNNVVIRKPKSNGAKSDDTVIIQGHLDMVCAKLDNSDFNFETDSLKLEVKDGYISASETTLGGDDGIAVAMALAVLESDSIIHPPLECVFTTDEEVGMLGAAAMDMSSLKGKYMLNIDSEEEGIFTVSCAGGVKLMMKLKSEGKIIRDKELLKIKVDGLLGGHSGVEIDKGRANACILLGRILGSLEKKFDIEIACINGGEKDNAIARTCEAVIGVSDTKMAMDEIAKLSDFYKKEYEQIDADLNVSVEKCDGEFNALDSRIIKILSSVPDGVQAMSSDIEGLVQTSLNLGVICSDKKGAELSFSLRSSIEDEKKGLIKKLTAIAEENGAEVFLEGDYPGWEFKQDSDLRKACIDVYKSQYGKEPVISAIHAGLECGIFSSKIEGLDCISFGPDILDIHTPQERLDIKSTERVYNFLIELLERLS